MSPEAWSIILLLAAAIDVVIVLAILNRLSSIFLLTRKSVGLLEGIKSNLDQKAVTDREIFELMEKINSNLQNK